MAARNKSKKTTKSRTKKAESAPRAKSTTKRVAKQASSSSARNRVGKNKPASRVRVARKAIREKLRNDTLKLPKRKRRSSAGGTAVLARGAAKRPVKAARRKTAASKSLNKATRSASVAKARSIKRATSKEVEAKLRSKSKDSRHAQEPTPTYEVVAPSAAERPGFAEASVPFESIELPAPLKSAASAVRAQKTAAPEEASSSAKSVKSAGQRHGFKLNEFVVYPAHGVGQIIGIEEQEVAGFKLELFVINFSKDKLTLRVPTSKVSAVGMRKISDPDTARRSLEIFDGTRPRQAHHVVAQGSGI